MEKRKSPSSMSMRTGDVGSMQTLSIATRMDLRSKTIITDVKTTPPSLMDIAMMPMVEWPRSVPRTLVLSLTGVISVQA